MTIKIKEIPVEERPRERLIKLGVENLNNEELLAILLKTGSKDESAKDLGIKLLNKCGGINKLDSINYHNLSNIKGIGPAKACTILTAIELGKRVKQDVNSLINIQVNSSNLVYRYFNNLFLNKKQEYFYCIYLDNKKRVLDVKLLFIGTINQSIVHPREVFKQAYLLSASAIICIHNHPSGGIEPSKEDIELTNRLSEIGYLTGIVLLDHLIIGHNNYYSFKEHGDIKEKGAKHVL